jgi:DNA-binding beta-propeller fold protein YncE
MLFPTYVTVDPQGSVYVTDTLNSRVQMFDASGNYVKSFGQRGNAWGMFDKPKGVALDSYGNVYVADSGWSNVQIFNQKGEILLFFGGNGRNPGLLWAPTAVTIDSQNRIYVADNLNHRVEVYQLVNTNAADSFLVPPDASKPDKSTELKKPEATK